MKSGLQIKEMMDMENQVKHDNERQYFLINFMICNKKAWYLLQIISNWKVSSNIFNVNGFVWFNCVHGI